MTTERPYGRDAVVEAVVEAAGRLFSERGPAAISLRDVANEANVNLGLIHRYIGSKEDLLATVLAMRPATFADLLEPEEIVSLLLGDDAEIAQYMRVIAHADLDGYDLPRLRPTMPLLSVTAKAMRKRFPPIEADVRTVLAAAMITGWHAVGRTYLKALGRRGLSDDALAAAFRPAIEALLAPPEPPAN